MHECLIWKTKKCFFFRSKSVFCRYVWLINQQKHMKQHDSLSRLTALINNKLLAACKRWLAGEEEELPLEEKGMRARLPVPSVVVSPAPAPAPAPTSTSRVLQHDPVQPLKSLWEVLFQAPPQAEAKLASNKEEKTVLPSCGAPTIESFSPGVQAPSLLPFRAYVKTEMFSAGCLLK